MLIGGLGSPQHPFNSNIVYNIIAFAALNININHVTVVHVIFIV